MSICETTADCICGKKSVYKYGLITYDGIEQHQHTTCLCGCHE